MDKDKIYLGHSAEYGAVYLSKHSWDCSWYWGFGYLGNKNCHFHFESFLKDSKYFDINNVFVKTELTQDTWWLLLDLFKQAYALRRASEIYQYGGHMCSDASITKLIANKEKAAIINADLELVLNKVWELLCNEQNK